MDKPKRTQGHISAFFTIFVWGTTFISTKFLLNDFSPVEVLFFRQILALAALLLFGLFARGPANNGSTREKFKNEMLFMAAGLCGVTLYFLFQNTALAYTQASNVGVLVSVAPLFSAITSHFFLKEDELHANFFIGFVISILGIILIAYNGSYILKLNPLGDLLAILAAFVWAFYSVTIRILSVRQYTTLQSTSRVFSYGLLFLMPVLPFFDFRLELARLVYLPNLLNILFLGLGASALCFITWNYAVSVLGVVKTSVYIYLVPVITIVSSALVLHEKITPVAIVGVVLILTGLFLSERKK